MRFHALLLALPWALVPLPGCAPGTDEPGGNLRAGDTPDAAPGDSVRASPAGAGEVRPGVAVLLSDSLGLVRGRRVGLVTNHTGVFGAGDWSAIAGVTDSLPSSVEVLHGHPDVDLVALYSPEHGLPGTAEAGEQVPSGRHEGTGLPIFSLYGSTYRPLPHMLDGVDVLLFDIQDIGSRYYTYVYTMALAMEAAGERGIPFVVLDRPNPIGGVHVQGNVLDTAFSSFIGMYPIPMRHGMTPGELARMYVGAFGVEVELSVVPAEGWRRGMRYEATGLPWLPPSPNMPSVESALHYAGTCLFEGTNLSVGRGTDRAFQWIGAPWVDGDALAAALNGRRLPGVRFEAVTFTPRAPGDGKFDGQEVRGVRFIATDPDAYDPTVAAVAALLETRRAAGDRWAWRADHFDRLAGTDRLRRAVERGDALETVVGAWTPDRTAFQERREPFLLYR